MLSRTEVVWQDGNWERFGWKEFFPLVSGAVHFWALRASEVWERQLHPEERRRHAKISHAGVRGDYAATQAGLRRILSLYRPEASEEVTIQRGPHGKPYVVGGPEFNLSHTPGGVFVAVSMDPIGLDVESADRSVAGMALAQKFFSESEIEELGLCSVVEQNRAFIRRWVCKEAMVKLSGEGIFLGLREALTMTEKTGLITGRYRGRRVWLREIWPQNNLCATLATWEPIEVKGFFRF